MKLRKILDRGSFWLILAMLRQTSPNIWFSANQHWYFTTQNGSNRDIWYAMGWLRRENTEVCKIPVIQLWEASIQEDFVCKNTIKNPCRVPSGNLTVCYWKWPFTVSFPMKNGDLWRFVGWIISGKVSHSFWDWLLVLWSPTTAPSILLFLAPVPRMIMPYFYYWLDAPRNSD